MAKVVVGVRMPPTDVELMERIARSRKLKGISLWIREVLQRELRKERAASDG